MTTSKGWINYRHQSDVLSNYQLLKSNGFDDEHIILILADDLAYANNNIDQGNIYDIKLNEFVTKQNNKQ